MFASFATLFKTDSQCNKQHGKIITYELQYAESYVIFTCLTLTDNEFFTITFLNVF